MAGESRVSVVPGINSIFVKKEHEVLVEVGACAAASFPDQLYVVAGAKIVSDLAELYRNANVLLKVPLPQIIATHYQK